MIYAIILFVVLFIATFIIHKPLNAHATENKWVKRAHFWLETAVVIQGMIIINQFLFLAP
jgi:hypothetical protein